MKRLTTILKQKPVFLNDFADEDAVFSEFRVDAKEGRGVKVLFASYGQDNYAGDAFVLFRKGLKLFEVNGGHCSCMGLEEQWEPEEVLLKELEHRIIEGGLGIDEWSGNTFRPEIVKFLGIKEAE